MLQKQAQTVQDSSPTSIIAAINQPEKGAEAMVLSAELMRDRIASLERANEAATNRRQRKRKRIQKQGILTKGAGEDLLAQHEADQQIAHEEPRKGAIRSRCSMCREAGYNACTCKKDDFGIN
ncbi:hypothetical protein COCC4DRAFT_62934 [Bipolaris maydis ATCC 48331]|uniref:Uncharacterized protein n=1 Tax=Cochliobolus heterostrophus (strain C4 / ATCC 48331 / race T) TaxID=665024 RepID=N4WRK5_COCH4|nr:uncharacterized protein COCC4DRAFT_62934 [Bipolaris maydis ATCC 48331]ENI03119.1 hypothetical protein COCC4DRAFT_62934 [Bipolaris maydis ATCC 48331]